LITLRSTTLVASLTLAFCAALQAAPLASGLDIAGMDRQVRPQDDLWHAMNGNWQKNTPIPADKSRVGGFIALDDLSKEQVKSVIDDLAAQKQAAGSVNQKIGDYYNAYMDTAAIDKAGLAPVLPLLKEAEALKTPHDIVALLGRWQGRVDTPLAFYVEPDRKNPAIYAPYVTQAGLGLPNRDFFLKDTPAFKKDREAYVAYLGKLLALSGDAKSAQHAPLVMDLEMKLAAAQWSSEQNRDAEKTFNPKSAKELAAIAPQIDWALLESTGEMPVPGDLVLREPSYFEALSGLLKSVPVSTWTLYFKVRVLDGEARLLPAAFREATFEMHDHVLGGLETDKPRWQRAVNNINTAMGEALGQAYVAKYFPPSSKARMEALVGNLMKAYATSIDGLTWMSPETKKAAHEKLAKYATKIGYPDTWRDYSKLEVRAGDPIGNELRAGRFEYLRQAVRVGHPIDRGEWQMTPQTVNAYYEPDMNEIAFPAAILQPPFFNPAADDAVNYGAIGAIIGHEISHGFDDQGSKFDGDGRLRNWWTEADRQAFDAIAGRLATQYSAYEPLPGQHLNGRLTLGENIADLSGLQISYKAYKLSLNGQPAPVIDGFTGDQRFFLGFAQAYRESRREALQQDFLTRDPHSPPVFRANGATVNADGFQEAFGVKPGDGMWKAPADRIRLW
jgi:putative endopeptidase